METGDSRVTGIGRVSLVQIPSVSINQWAEVGEELILNGEFMINNCFDKVRKDYNCQDIANFRYWKGL